MRLLAFLQSERDKLSALPTVTQMNDTNGYAVHIDSSTKTAGEVTVPDGVLTQITNDGATFYDHLPSSGHDFVSGMGDAVFDQENALYSIGVRMQIAPTVRDKRFVWRFIAVDGAGPGNDIEVYSRGDRFAKQLEDEDRSISFTLPCLASIVNKPISVFIETEDTDAIIWGQELSVSKLNGPIV